MSLLCWQIPQSEALRLRKVPLCNFAGPKVPPDLLDRESNLAPTRET